MTRDELARHLYISTPDPLAAPGPVPQWEQEVLARSWDGGGAQSDCVADCYARADRMIRDGQATQ